jgi:hypothetical protein
MGPIYVALAFIVAALVAAITIAVRFAVQLVRVHRHHRHDIAGALAVARLALQAGDIEGADTTIASTACYIHPEGIQRIRLRRLLMLLTSGLAVRYGRDAFELDADREVVITLDVAPLHRALVNALRNAVEAREAAEAAQPVMVRLGPGRIDIVNPATPVDRQWVIGTSCGSTRGNGRGTGRGSIADCCQEIDWDVEWSVEGETVITSLHW